ncbi:Hypp5221 [Branchiostoma lanceolatum]|uniref:Hypp5221 protein n=1 Tax=Branchiostoma lanceolatum TaxID=7740 RepID=A0A8K0AEN1_BRALA|nr:Hypp5221 [Branchiostoma lanceolatum]
MTSLTALLALMVFSAPVWGLPAGPSVARNPQPLQGGGDVEEGVALPWMENYREQEPLAADVDGSMPKRAYFGSGFRYHLLFPHPIWNQKQAQSRGGRSNV